MGNPVRLRYNKIMAKQSKTTTPTVQVNTTGGAVRISHPTSKRGKATAKEKAAVVVDVVTPRSVDGFIDFLREKAVVGLAIGIVIGTQIKVITDALNNGFISPLFALLFNGGSLQERFTTLHWHGRAADLKWGIVIYQIINFVFILAVFYALIKFFKLDKLDKKPESKK
jgi:large-conductance mechanosensitive channel